jgi:hypothetical protein
MAEFEKLVADDALRSMGLSQFRIVFGLSVAFVLLFLLVRTTVFGVELVCGALPTSMTHIILSAFVLSNPSLSLFRSLCSSI